MKQGCRDGTCGNADDGEYRPGQCRTCWHKIHNPEYAAVIIAAARPKTAEIQLAPGRAVASVRPTAAKKDCRFRGPELTGVERQQLYDAGQTQITHGRKFALCTKPGFSLEGRAMCQCAVKGQPICGQPCPGFAL